MSEFFRKNLNKTWSNKYPKWRKILHFEENQFFLIWIPERLIFFVFWFLHFLCKFVTSRSFWEPLVWYFWPFSVVFTMYFCITFRNLIFCIHFWTDWPLGGIWSIEKEKRAILLNSFFASRATEAKFLLAYRLTS